MRHRSGGGVLRAFTVNVRDTFGSAKSEGSTTMRIINMVRDWWSCRRECGLELNARGCPVVVWQCQRPWCRGRQEWAEWLERNPQVAS